MAKLMNLDLFGGPPHPLENGRLNRDAEETKEMNRRKASWINKFNFGLHIKCPQCNDLLVITPSYYLTCLKGHTKLIDPRDLWQAGVIVEVGNED